MNRIILLLPLFLLLTCCSSPTSGNGGGTEAGNAKISGVAYRSNGDECQSGLVSAIPCNFIPGVHSSSLISRGITDSQGVFSLSVPDSDKFNIYIKDTMSNEQTLLRSIQKQSSLYSDLEVHLKRPGTLKVVHPEISHSLSYFYITGMEYTFSYSSQDSANDTLYIETLPSVELPTVQLTIDDKKISISKTIISPDKTVTITLDTTDQNVEVWNFSLIAGISKETMEATGNLDSLITLIEQQVTQINEKFNKDSKLQGLFHYSVDSVYVLSGTVSNEIDRPLSGYNYRLIYHGHGAGNFTEWSAATNTILNHQDEAEGMGTNLFNNEATGKLLSLFALSRGCITTTSMEVSPLNNPISKDPYIPELSIMFKPDIYSRWCDFNRAVLNLRKDSIVTSSFIENSKLQQNVSIAVTEFGSKAPVSNALVELFWVDPETATVNTNAAFSGNTNENGIMKFDYNPYRPDTLTLPSEYYTNCLIRVIHAGDTQSVWMPILDLGEAFIEDSTEAFVLEVEL